jgi:hypothetical protein
MTKERSMGGNKRSKTEMLKIEQKIRDLMYNENPRYNDQERLGILQIPREHTIGTSPGSGKKTNQRENRKGLKK